MTAICKTCNGTGKIFHCGQWPKCGCSVGSREPFCEGRTIPCTLCEQGATIARLLVDLGHAEQSQYCAQMIDDYPTFKREHDYWSNRIDTLKRELRDAGYNSEVKGEEE